jgi:regulator of PEP synthase PpsR (kinase-PPPase family)
MSPPGPSYFHLHLVSDATGETLTIMAKAAAVQYGQVRPIEHVHPLVRTQRQLNRVLQEIQSAPGIVLYTIVNRDLTSVLEQRCRELGVPSLHVLEPIMKVFESYLGAPQTPIVAGQHVLDADYFRRIDALNFAMAHDDGHLPGDLNEADIIILGISRTSKTPTSIYLAQRGYKTANVPLVPGIEPPAALTGPHKAFIVGLIASPERIAEIRRNRVRLMADRNLDDYVDRTQIANEIAYSRRLCARHGWPVIDVTRRSIEETAATITKLLHDRETATTDNGTDEAAGGWACGKEARAGLGQPLAPADAGGGRAHLHCRAGRSRRARHSRDLVRWRRPGGSRRRRRGSGPRQGRGNQWRATRHHCHRCRSGAGPGRRDFREACRPRWRPRASHEAQRPHASAPLCRGAGGGGRDRMGACRYRPCHAHPVQASASSARSIRRLSIGCR